MSNQNPKDQKMKIKISHKDIPIGHQEYTSGSGPHNNKPKRERTRERQIKKSIEEYE